MYVKLFTKKSGLWTTFFHDVNKNLSTKYSVKKWGKNRV